MPIGQHIQRADDVVASSRPLWGWLGQAAVVVLGTHLACDSLDDYVLDLLTWLPLRWASPGDAAVPAAWVAVVLELTVAAWVVSRLWLLYPQPEMTWSRWKRHLSVRDIVLPAFWVPVSIAGAWVIGMAVEDLVAPYQATLGAVLGWVAMALVVWRLGWTGLMTVITGPPARSRLAGLWIAPILLGLAGLAVAELPLWGWL